MTEKNTRLKAAGVFVLGTVLLLIVAVLLVLPASHELIDLKTRGLVPEAGRFIDIGGVSLYYEDWGRGDAVVLVHGMFSSGLTWSRIAPNIAALGRRVVIVDLPGFGLSGNPRGSPEARVYGQTYLAGTLLAFIDRLGIGRFEIVGNGIGGGVAWRLAAEQPGRITRLILVSPAGLPPRPRGSALSRLMALPLAGEFFARLLPNDFIVGLVERAYARPALFTPAMKGGYLFRANLKGHRVAWARWLRYRDEESFAPLIEKVRAPTLILWGDGDRIAPPSQAESFARKIHGSRVVKLEGCGHMPQEECPRAFLEAAISFLKPAKPGLEGGGGGMIP